MASTEDTRAEFLRVLKIRTRLTDPALLAAVTAIPRDEFIGDIYERTNITTGRFEPIERGSERWLARMSDPSFSLVTAISRENEAEDGIPRIAATAPVTVARMLELGAFREGERVLQVGTGPGYLAALLAHRLGAGNVTSVDIDEEAISAATATLRKLVSTGILSGMPRLEVANANDFEDRLGGQRFDGIISTVSFERVPPAWLPRINPGGRVVAPLGGAGTAAGRVVTLTADHTGHLAGRFAPFMSDIMRDRDLDSAPARTTAPLTMRPGGTRLTENELTDLDFAFFAGLHQPDLRLPVAADSRGLVEIVGRNGDYAVASVKVPPGRPLGQARQAGEEDLFKIVEGIHGRWQAQGSPKPHELGLTIDPNGTHKYWVRTPDKVLNTQAASPLAPAPRAAPRPSATNPHPRLPGDVSRTGPVTARRPPHKGPTGT